jgi:K+-sensing histidine kinase KdpD
MDMAFRFCRHIYAGRHLRTNLSLPERVVAEIMAWKEEHVARIIKRYVDRSAATRAIIQHLNERRT